MYDSVATYSYIPLLVYVATVRTTISVATYHYYCGYVPLLLWLRTTTSVRSYSTYHY